MTERSGGSGKTASFEQARGAKSRPGPRRRAAKRPYDSEATRENILNAATRIFAERGLSGGRINLISRAAKSNDRMIYYYFGSKERLFIEVLEKVYRDMWEAENALALDQADPVDALTRFVHFTLDHYLAHPEMLTILNNENLHKGRYVRKSKKLKELSSPALRLMERIYRRGVEQGVFRKGVEPLKLYLSVLALNYFYVSNIHTLSAFLDVDLTGNNLPAWRDWVVDVILRSVGPGR
ncbi:MAG: TetR family transcriptional regulator [Xanthobacteraceae bacterium]|uniref:TetR family transcriptional regulator n=1 Tax=Pseudolabrys sp. TaxID=1960880 RepID=UPI003D14ECC4